MGDTWRIFSDDDGETDFIFSDSPDDPDRLRIAMPTIGEYFVENCGDFEMWFDLTEEEVQGLADYLNDWLMKRVDARGEAVPDE